jgi:arylsulfatase A-like enzyme
MSAQHHLHPRRSTARRLCRLLRQRHHPHTTHRPLAASGSRFSQTFAQHPQCAPSRAVLMTGRYPHENGSTSNHTAMASNEHTLGQTFRAAGYRSIGLGKLHLFDEKEQSSFDETQLTGGQQSDATSPNVLHADYKS